MHRVQLHKRKTRKNTGIKGWDARLESLVNSLVCCWKLCPNSRNVVSFIDESWDTLARFKLQLGIINLFRRNAELTFVWSFYYFYIIFIFLFDHIKSCSHEFSSCHAAKALCYIHWFINNQNNNVVQVFYKSRWI